MLYYTLFAALFCKESRKGAIALAGAGQLEMSSSADGVGEYRRLLSGFIGLKSMKMKGFAAFLLATCVALTGWLGFAAPSWAYIEDDVDFLKMNNECPVCILNDADLSNQDFHDANLKVASLTGANLSNTDLSHTNLMLAELVETNLTGANLSRAEMNGAQVQNADLTGADLSGATMTQSNLTDANFTDAKLIGTELTAAVVGVANFTGADLTDANLRAVNRSRAIFCHTTMPDGNEENRDC